MKLSDLNNEEVLFMYFSNRKWLDIYDDVFEHGSIEDVLSILDFGQIRVTQNLTDEDIERMKNSSHYKIALTVEAKLYPLVDMIQDADVDLYNSVVDCFKKAEI